MLTRATQNRTAVPGVPTGVVDPPKPAPVTFTMPAPPSTNALFKDTVKGRAPTGQYLDWKMQAATAIRMQNVGKVAGRVIRAKPTSTIVSRRRRTRWSRLRSSMMTAS